MSRTGWQRTLVIAGIALIAGYVAAFGGEYSVLDLRRGRAELVRMQSELDSLRQESARLSARIDSLQSDSFLLERLAREEFGMIRDGDLLYRFVEPDSAAAKEDEENR